MLAGEVGIHAPRHRLKIQAVRGDGAKMLHPRFELPSVGKGCLIRMGCALGI